MDPHKRSVTIEVMTGDETILGGGRYATDQTGFAAMRRYVSQFPDRVWAIEGCSGIGHHVAMRLLAAGEEVVEGQRHTAECGTRAAKTSGGVPGPVGRAVAGLRHSPGRRCCARPPRSG